MTNETHQASTPNIIRKQYNFFCCGNKKFYKQILEKLTSIDERLKKQEGLMSLISEFADAQNAFNDRLDSAIAGLTGDITSLKNKIEQLLASDTISDADKALLIALKTRAETMTTTLEALDALTPPEVPTA